MVSINDIQIIFIDTADPSELTRKEECWQAKFKILEEYRGISLLVTLYIAALV